MVLTERAGKKEDARVVVFVTAADKKDAKGRPAPIPGASVSWGNTSTGTDADGKATISFTGQLGVDIRIEAPGYKPGATSVDGGRYFQVSEFTRQVTLQPADASDATPILLTVRLIDAATKDQRVKGARVRILATNGGQFGKDAFTLDAGEADFTLTHDASSQAREGLFVEVDASADYGPSRTTIPASMLRPSKEPLVYLVQLSSLTDGELGALEAEVQRLEALRQEILGKQSAAAAAAAEAVKHDEDARGAALAWKQMVNTRPTGIYGENAPNILALCNAVLQETQKLQQEADRREKKAINLLDRARQGIEKCTSAAQADEAMTHYTQGAAETGAMLAASQRARIRLNQMGPQPEANTPALTDYSALLKRAAEQAGQAAGAAQQAMQELASKLVELKGGKARATARLSAVRARKQLSAAHYAMLNTLAGRLAALEAGLPGTDQAKFARERANSAAKWRTDAEKSYAGFDPQTCFVARKQFTQAVENYENNHTAVTMALANISNLPKLADECRQRVLAAANAPVPVPDLSGVPSSDMARVVRASRLAWGGLTPAGPAPRADLANRYASQQPGAGKLAAPGSPVQAFIWQAYQAPPPPVPPPPPPEQQTGGPAPAQLVTVPNLARHTGRAAMESALYAAGLTPAFSNPAVATPKGMQGKLSGQFPVPGARVLRGSEVVFGVYPAAEAQSTPVPSAPFDPAVAAGGVPGVIGDSLEVAQAKLEAAGLHVGGISRGGRAPTKPEQAGRIYSQSPGAGSPLPRNRAVALWQYDNYEAPVAQTAPGSPAALGSPGAPGSSGSSGSSGSPGSTGSPGSPGSPNAGGILGDVAPPVVTYGGSTQPAQQPTPPPGSMPPQPPVYRPPDAPTTTTSLPPDLPKAIAGILGQLPGVQGSRGPVLGAPLPPPRAPAAGTPAPPPPVTPTSPSPPPPTSGGAAGCSIPSIAGQWANANGFTYEISQSGSSFSWRNTSRRDGLSDGGTGQFLNSTKVRGNFIIGSNQSSAEGNVYALDSKCRAKRIQWNNGLNVFRD